MRARYQVNHTVAIENMIKSPSSSENHVVWLILLIILTSSHQANTNTEIPIGSLTKNLLENKQETPLHLLQTLVKDLPMAASFKNMATSTRSNDFQNLDKISCIEYLKRNQAGLLQIINLEPEVTQEEMRKKRMLTKTAVENEGIKHEVEKNEKLMQELNKLREEAYRNKVLNQQITTRMTKENEKLKEQLEKCRNSSKNEAENLNDESYESRMLLLNKKTEEHKNFEANVTFYKKEVDRLTVLWQTEKNELNRILNQIDSWRIAYSKCRCDDNCYNNLVAEKNRVEQEKNKCQQCRFISRLTCNLW